MAGYIELAISIILFAAAAIGYFMKEASRRVESEARDEALKTSISNLTATVELEVGHVRKDVQGIENILGNGHGLIHDVREMKTCCAGAMAEVRGDIKDIHTRLSAQQHEIDEVKGGK
jgi:hypothetical protein